MIPPILLNRSPKSIGLAILLTILYGSIGLFWASVSGALIMLLAPIIVIALLIIGVVQDNREHLNNGAKPKSHMSRDNNLILILC